MEDLTLLLQFALPIVLLTVAYAIGSWTEQRHFRDLVRRENIYRPRMPVLTLPEAPAGWQVDRSGLVTGSVVISLDYFKRFLAGLRAIFGGRIKAYEPLMDRARREALLRMMESARAEGYSAVLNVRIETSRLASSRGDGKGTAGVEILAFGTGVHRAKA